MIEAVAKAIADVMFKRRNGRTMMPWDVSPERDEAIAYAGAAITAIRSSAEKVFADGGCTFRDIEGFRTVMKAMVAEADDGQS